jgi:hypothetical protein
MPSFSSLIVPARRSLAAPLGRLCHTLDQLSKEVRAAVIQAISQAVAEAVRDTLHNLLEGPPFRSDPHEWSAGLPARSPRSWDRSGEDSWYEDIYEQLEDDLLYPRSSTYERSNTRPRERELTSDAPSVSSTWVHHMRWKQPVMAGCQATAWWLARQRGRFSVPVALGVGLAGGLAALVTGSLAFAAASMIASVLGLLALADLTRSRD